VLGARFFALIAIVAALCVARVASSAAVPSWDRAELPQSPLGDDGQPPDDGGDADDGLDLILPPHTTWTAVLSPARRLAVEAERAPATSAFAPCIFRPPISALA
jgi:hypothetical protein